MRRIGILSLGAVLSFACVPYELNPDAGWDGGGEGPDSGHPDDGGSQEFPDGGGGVIYPDGGVTIPLCQGYDPKGLCIEIQPPGGGGPEVRDFPGSGVGGDPGTGVLFLVRIDRGTANLAARYEVMVQQALEELSDAKLSVHSVAVASLYSGQLLWSPNLGTSLAGVLTQAAASTDGNPDLPCTTAHLASLAADLPTRTDPSGWPVFTTPFSAFMVIVLESGARPYQPGESACEVGGAPAIAHFTPETASWLATPTGRSLPRPQVQFVTVATPEGVTTAEIKTACSQTSMDPSAIDSLEASPVAFIGPFASGLNSAQSDSAKQLDFCPQYAGKWASNISSTARSWVSRLRAQPKWE